LVEPNFSELAGGENGKLRYKLLSGIIKINRFIKTVNVGFSLFHHFALTESWLADTGAGPMAPIRAFQNLLDAPKRFKELYNNPEKAAAWINHGLMIDVTPMDIDLNLLDNAIGFVADKFDDGNQKWLGSRVRELGNVKRSFDNFLWHKMLPIMKLQMADDAMKAAQKSGAFPDVVENPVTDAELIADARMRDDIAKYVNDALGSQEWTQYTWATPFARDVMNTFLFAPDWTISALNISGVPEMGASLVQAEWLGYRPNTDFGTWRRLTRYWPGFYTWIFLAIPAVMQAAVTAAFGDPEEDDKWFVWQNEKNFKSSADLTPMLRHAAKQKGILPPTRRSYAQAGKQAREVLHWLKDPVATLFGKSAAVVRVPVTAVTGVIKPSLLSDDIWTAKDDVDKWTKIAGNLMPFAATSISRQEVVGGPAGLLISMALPRRAGLSMFAAGKEIGEIVTNFSSDADVRNLAPAVAHKVLVDRIEAVKERLERQGATRDQVKAAVGKGMSDARTPLAKAIRDEWKKGPKTADGKKIASDLIALSMLYRTNKEFISALNSGIKQSLAHHGDALTAPQKQAYLSAKKSSFNRPEVRDATRATAASRSSVFRLSPKKLTRRKPE
jgi:hypothetical protein